MMRRAVAGIFLSAALAASAQALLWPLRDTGGVQYTSSGYGLRSRPMGGGAGGFHAGIDIACRVGTPVLAAGTGKVLVCALKDPTYGNYLVLRLDDGRDVLYGHLKEAWYGRGQRVERGWIIALSGNSGYSTGPHLHFAVSEDPAPLFAPAREWHGMH